MSSPNGRPEDTWASRSYPVKEDMEFQRVTWKLQRCGWAAFAIVIGLALAGLFAKGPLSSASAGSDSGRLRVEYARFQRFDSATTMRVRIDAGDERKIAVRLGDDFIRSFKIDAVHPGPAEEHGGNSGVAMIFLSAPEGPLTIHYTLRPQNIGMVRSEIGIVGGAPVRFTQFVFP